MNAREFKLRQKITCGKHELDSTGAIPEGVEYCDYPECYELLCKKCAPVSLVVDYDTRCFCYKHTKVVNVWTFGVKCALTS